MSTSMNARDFLAHFERGVARQNRFRVEFNLPRGVSASAPGVNMDAVEGNIGRLQSYFNQGRGSVNIKCHTATFPQRSLLTSEQVQNSAAFRVPYSASYDPVTFSFYADSDLDTRDYFDVWQSAANNFQNNTMNFFSEYVSDVNIIALDVLGNDTYGVTLYEAWPMNIGVLDYSYANMDSFQTTIVTMSFKSWLPTYGGKTMNSVGTNRSGS